jgi:molybdenum-dependent DNA-binding transcriptional regulator ModE
MAGRLDSDSQIGRRLSLRDLHLFFTVVQHGSMAKAASQLGISQPAVSEVIADLERILGARLFDRRPRAVSSPPCTGTRCSPVRVEARC